MHTFISRTIIIIVIPLRMQQSLPYGSCKCYCYYNCSVYYYRHCENQNSSRCILPKSYYCTCTVEESVISTTREYFQMQSLSKIWRRHWRCYLCLKASCCRHCYWLKSLSVNKTSFDIWPINWTGPNYKLTKSDWEEWINQSDTAFNITW